MALQEEDREKTDKENKGSTGHLVDWRGNKEETNVHERRSGNITARRDGEEEDLQSSDGGTAIGILHERLNSGRDMVGGFVASSDRLIPGALTAVLDKHLWERETTNDQPAAHLTDKHLETVYETSVSSCSPLFPRLPEFQGTGG